MIEFTSKHIEKEDRFDAWTQVLHSVCGHFVPSLAAPKAEFSGTFHVRNFAGLDIARLSHTTPRIQRARSHISRSDDGYYFLLLQLSGTSLMAQAGNEAALKPGDMTLLDASRPCDLLYSPRSCELSLHIPRQALDGKRPIGPRHLGRVISGQEGGGLVISQMMQAIFDGGTAAGSHGSPAMTDAVLNLVCGCAIDGPDEALGTLERSHDLQCDVIRRYIEKRLFDPDLSPQKIAAAHRMSVRHLYRLFEASEVSIGDLIRQRRLEKCAEDLANPLLARRNVTQVAFSWGFNDSAHFSRAFKAEFGLSPREFRRHRLGGDQGGNGET
ncbi:MAG TPA: transcriptional regulator FeaR [Magnetospirillum sp.]|nr:transcriptional regulator FeaR [Magnetospirillum sp.]